MLNGGFAEWQKQGYPISNETPKPAMVNFKPVSQQDWLVTAQEINARDHHYKVFDSRTSDRYRGENETIDPVAGHIPGAFSAPFVDNLGANGQFLEKEQLIERFEKLLSDHPIEQAVFYCGSGVTACHNLLALSYIGKEGAKLYPGSWSEWITDETRPIALGD